MKTMKKPGDATINRENARALVDSPRFHSFIIFIILIDAVAVGVSTFDLNPGLEMALKVIDYLCLMVYIIETVLKLYAWRSDYFKDGWNIFDFIIITMSMIPDSLLPIPLRVARIMRLFRVGRVFKLVSAFKQLRVIVEAIGRSMSGVAWTALLLILVMYVFDVAGFPLFGEAFPQYFDNLGNGFFTLFEILTLEGWNEIAHNVIDVYPAAWLYFVPYVIISAFIMINVVTGIIINAVDESTQIERINRYDSEEAQLVTELGELKAQVETVQYLLSKMCIQMAPEEKSEGVEDAIEPEETEDSED